MHKLMEFICDELEELERKVEKGGKLSMAEVEYGDKLAHFKKNLLKADELWEEGDYSMARPYEDGGMPNRSYARGGGRRRGANQYGSYAGGSYMDGYSRADEDFMSELRGLMQNAPNEHIRKKMQEIVSGM